jgi:hypothetical protein
MHRQAWKLLLILVCTAAFPSILGAQQDLQYQLRSDKAVGNWKEGIKPKPVAGSILELISVLADYQEPLPDGKFPPSGKLQFYLDEPHHVFLTIRELDYRTYYWLDHVTPSRPWEKGFQNAFVWPSDPVLQQLIPPLDLYDLGGLIRLDAETPSGVERIAPGVLFHHTPPSKIEGYVFTFTTGEDVRVLISILQEATGNTVDSRTFRRKRAGRPFTIHWKAGEAEPGFYKLEITGMSLSTNLAIAKDIYFFHQPFLQP